jgi:hypothetical protein
VGCINEYAGVLRCNDGFDDSGKIVYIWKGLDAKENVVKAAGLT